MLGYPLFESLSIQATIGATSLFPQSVLVMNFATGSFVFVTSPVRAATTTPSLLRYCAVVQSHTRLRQGLIVSACLDMPTHPLPPRSRLRRVPGRPRGLAEMPRAQTARRLLKGQTTFRPACPVLCIGYEIGRRTWSSYIWPCTSILRVPRDLSGLTSQSIWFRSTAEAHTPIRRAFFGGGLSTEYEDDASDDGLAAARRFAGLIESRSCRGRTT